MIAECLLIRDENRYLLEHLVNEVAGGNVADETTHTADNKKNAVYFVGGIFLLLHVKHYAGAVK